MTYSHFPTTIAGMASDPDLGTRIKRAREVKRWTQRQLADALKVDRKTVDNWENGRTSPRNSIGALEEVLGISLSEEAPEPQISQALERAIREQIPDVADQERVLEFIRLVRSGRLPARGEASAERRKREDLAG